MGSPQWAQNDEPDTAALTLEPPAAAPSAPPEQMNLKRLTVEHLVIGREGGPQLVLTAMERTAGVWIGPGGDRSIGIYADQGRLVMCLNGPKTAGTPGSDAAVVMEQDGCLYLQYRNAAGKLVISPLTVLLAALSALVGPCDERRDTVPGNLTLRDIA